MGKGEHLRSSMLTQDTDTEINSQVIEHMYRGEWDGLRTVLSPITQIDGSIHVFGRIYRHARKVGSFERTIHHIDGSLHVQHTNFLYAVTPEFMRAWSDHCQAWYDRLHITAT